MVGFYLDHNVAREVADHLREFGHVAHTAYELGTDRDGDEAHLILAARSGWTLIPHNGGDFLLLHAAWQLWTREWTIERHHGGILILYPPIAPLQAAQEVAALLEIESTLQDTLWTWRRGTRWLQR